MRQHDRIIDISRWGKDHWSTFLYVETRVVDHGGGLSKPHLRSDGVKYPTRLQSTEDTIPGHNDWDCLEDMEQASLITINGTGLNPVYSLTDEGWRIAGLCRRWRAEGKRLINFKVAA